MMKIDFADGRVTMVVCPVDCRCGYRRLADIAYKVLNIDVSLGEDYVVFVSKSRGICKIIHCAEYGPLLIVRMLHRGRFERFLMEAEGPAAKPLTPQELSKFLDGEPLYVKRESFWRG